MKLKSPLISGASGAGIKFPGPRERVGNDQRQSFGKEFLPPDQSLELPSSEEEMQFFGSKIAREGGRLTRNGSGDGGTTTAAARKTKINRSLSLSLCEGRRGSIPPSFHPAQGKDEMVEGISLSSRQALARCEIINP